MDRYRLIVSIVVLFVYLLAMYPWQTITVALLLFIAYFVIRNLNSANTEHNGNAMRRRMALNEARIYLAPYNDIWKNLKLSNKYCILRLGLDGQTITGYDIANNRSFRVVKSRIHAINDLWDMFCMSFSHNTTFDGLVEKCDLYQAEIQLNFNNYQKQAVNIDNNKTRETAGFNVSNQKNEQNTESNNNINKLDINNASEVELTALPGISIVMAKKLIKKRDEIGGFKSVKDVFLFLKLKPHLQLQLENRICVNKMKSGGKIKRYNERSIDL